VTVTNLISSGTVTMTFSSKQDLTRGLGALRQEAQAPTLRDVGSLLEMLRRIRKAVRTPPAALTGQSYIAVTVRSGASMASRRDMARTQRSRCGEQRPHYRPELIFPGDTVYLASGAPATRSAAASGQ
jgi:hypothetical protein